MQMRPHLRMRFSPTPEKLLTKSGSDIASMSLKTQLS
jgi:hypothetical protein